MLTEEDHLEIQREMFVKLDNLIDKNILSRLATPIFCMGWCMAMLVVSKKLSDYADKSRK